MAFSAADRDRAIALRAMFGIGGGDRSTCNRVEIYYAREVHGHPRAEEICAFWVSFITWTPPSWRSHLYEKTDRDAGAPVRGVIILDSMALGETQILGQVRRYDERGRRGVRGALNPLFQRAIAVGKEGASQRNRRGPPEHRERVGGLRAADFRLVRGQNGAEHRAGKMASLVLQSFRHEAKRLLVCNRSPDKAAELSKKFGGEAVALERLGEHRAASGHRVSATGRGRSSRRPGCSRPAAGDAVSPDLHDRHRAAAGRRGGCG